MSRPREKALITPEGVPLRFELASLGERGLAIVIDLAILGATTLGALLLLTLILYTEFLADAATAAIFLAAFVLRHGYFGFFEAFWNGATPGKRALRLQVVSRDGGALGLDAVLARNILRDVELVLPIAALLSPTALVGSSPGWLCAPALGWVFVIGLLPLLSRERQRAGDIVANTLIVRVPAAELKPDEAARRRAGDRPITFTRAELGVYGEYELETLADVLRRVEEDRLHEQDLTAIARTIARKIGRRRASVEDPRRFLREFYRAQRAFLERQLLRGRRKRSKTDSSAR